MNDLQSRAYRLAATLAAIALTFAFSAHAGSDADWLPGGVSATPGYGPASDRYAPAALAPPIEPQTYGCAACLRTAPAPPPAPVFQYVPPEVRYSAPPVERYEAPAPVRHYDPSPAYVDSAPAYHYSAPDYRAQLAAEVARLPHRDLSLPDGALAQAIAHGSSAPRAHALIVQRASDDAPAAVRSGGGRSINDNPPQHAVRQYHNPSAQSRAADANTTVRP